MDRVGKSKTGTTINLSMNSRKNTSSTAMNANGAASTSRTFMGESSVERPDQPLRLDQRDVNKSIHEPNHSTGDNYGSRSKSAPVPVNRETDEVCTDEPTSTHGATSIVKDTQFITSKFNSTRISDGIVRKRKIYALEEKIKGLFIETDRVIDSERFESLEDLLNCLSSDMTDSELRNICSKVCESIASFYPGVNIFSIAIKYNQISLIKLILKTGFNTKIEAFGRNERDLIRTAVQQGSVEMVKLLFSLFADAADQADQADDSWPPHLASCLTTAVIIGSVEHAKLLLSLGADINGMIIDKDGSHRWTWNPLTTAILFNKIEMITFLLDVGKADPNEGTGNAPLMAAAYCNDVRSVKLLLIRGAEITNDFINSKLAQTALNHENINTELGLMVKEAKLRCKEEYVDSHKLLLLDEKKDCPFRLRAFCYRAIDLFSHSCKSIDERKVFAGKLGLPSGLERPFHLGFNKDGSKINGKNYSQAFHQH